MGGAPEGLVELLLPEVQRRGGVVFCFRQVGLGGFYLANVTYSFFGVLMFCWFLLVFVGFCGCQKCFW